MDEFATNFITVYGPLGFGWVAACFLAWNYRNQASRTQEILIHVIEANTKAMSELKTWLEAKVE